MNDFISFVTLASQSTNDINELLSSMSQNIKQSELVIINNCQASKEAFKDLRKYDNVITKLVTPGKPSKLYAIEGLSWKTAIGDLVIYCNDAIADLANQLQETIQLVKDKGLVFITPSIVSHKCSVYNNISEAYDNIAGENLGDVIGFAADRKTLNAAMNTQNENYDVFISLFTNAKSKISIITLNHQTSIDNYKYHSFYDRVELMILFTKTAILERVFALTSLISLAVMFLTMLSNYGFKDYGVSVLINGLLTYAFSFSACMSFVNFITNRLALAAAQNRNLAGQFSVEVL